MPRLLTNRLFDYAATYPEGAYFINTVDDLIPNFAQIPTIFSVASGDWSSNGTWDLGRVPNSSDIVGIKTTHTVTVVNTSAVALSVGVAGKLKFSRSTDSKLRCRDVLVYLSGNYDQGTELDPIPEGVTATLEFADVALHGSAGEYSNGLLSLGITTVNGGRFVEPFHRLAVAPLATDTTLSLVSAPTTWRIGDTIVLPGTEQAFSFTPVNHYEVRTISNISGTTITLSSALTYPHPGSFDNVLTAQKLPHVFNLSRGVKIQSENPAGVRGHVLCTNRCDGNIQNCEFVGLGRTTIFGNQIGRYSLHAHHLFGPHPVTSSYQFYCRGNSFYELGTNPSVRWPIAIHDSHYGYYGKNVVYNAHGAGIMLEQGNETENIIEFNGLVRIRGMGGRAALGNEGVGIYAIGPNSRIRDNVATDCWNTGATPEAAFGYKYYQVYLGNIAIPNFPGADTYDIDEVTIVSSYIVAIKEFARNEVYGSDNGMTFWWIGTFGAGGGTDATPRSYIDDLLVWNIYFYGIYAYETNKLTLRRYIAKGYGGTALFWGDYYVRLFELVDSKIEYSSGTGVNLSTAHHFGGGPHLKIINTEFDCGTDIYWYTMYTSSYRSDWIAPREIEIRDCLFNTLYAHYRTTLVVQTYIESDIMRVYNYNQQAAEDYRIYYAEQVGTHIVPQRTFNGDGSPIIEGSPEAGKDNTYNWATYGIAIAGAILPGTAVTKSWIIGGLADPIIE